MTKRLKQTAILVLMAIVLTIIGVLIYENYQANNLNDSLLNTIESLELDRERITKLYRQTRDNLTRAEERLRDYTEIESRLEDAESRLRDTVQRNAELESRLRESIDNITDYSDGIDEAQRRAINHNQDATDIIRELRERINTSN